MGRLGGCRSHGLSRDLLDSGTGIEHCGKEGIVAPSVCRPSVHGHQDRLDLVVLRLSAGRGASPFEGYAEYPLKLLSADQDAGLYSERIVDGREAHVAGACTIAAFLFEMQRKASTCSASMSLMSEADNGQPPFVQRRSEAAAAAVAALYCARMGAHPRRRGRWSTKKSRRARAKTVGCGVVMIHPHWRDRCDGAATLCE